MEGNVFVNEAISKAIADYIKFKERPDRGEFHSFLVVVIRTLVLIYGELDIVNPYRTNNVVGFDTNLKKFGCSGEVLEEFKRQMLAFFQNSENETMERELFVSIEKTLIDLFALRKKSVDVTEEEVNQFKSLLYLKNDANSYKNELYMKYTPNSDILLYYLNNKLFEVKHNFTFTEFKDVALSAEAYQLAGFNAAQVMHLKDEEIENINNKVYHFFRIKDNDLNKRGRLDEAIRYYKKYGNTITSGNGYVDLLLLMSVIATGLMLVVVVGIQFMR